MFSSVTVACCVDSFLIFDDTYVFNHLLVAMECMKKLIDFICCRNSQIAPQTYYCTICFEEGKLRHCCKSVLCDYDYTKDKFCPICKNSTKMDKVTGAVFMIPHYSEHEECRICLGPGLKRRCCGQYYCDECYCKSDFFRMQ